MKYTELKEREIYYCQWHNDRDEYIFRYKSGRQQYISKESYDSGLFDDGEKLNEFKEATQQEKEHFLQCEKAGKYVEYKPENIEILIFN